MSAASVIFSNVCRNTDVTTLNISICRLNCSSDLGLILIHICVCLETAVSQNNFSLEFVDTQVTHENGKLIT